jgi:hypothetical protein
VLHPTEMAIGADNCCGGGMTAEAEAADAYSSFSQSASGQRVAYDVEHPPDVIFKQSSSGSWYRIVS